MVYANKKKSYAGRKSALRKRVLRKTKSSALSIAKKALSKVNKLSKSTTEQKFLSFASQTDIGGTAGSLGEAFGHQMVTTVGQTVLFGSDSITGNKSFLKYIKGQFEIHSDNINNEEETVNLTVAIVQAKKHNEALSASSVSSIQGQAYFDPRLWTIKYYKHQTITMGGTSPGTSGQMLMRGYFRVPVNKQIRWVAQGATGAVNSSPASSQDEMYFLVFTDNTIVDTESPRMNFRVMQVYEDIDLNH